MLSHSSLTHCLTCYRIWDWYFLSTLCSYHLTIFWFLLFLKSAVSVIVLFCCGLVFLSGDFITMCRVSLSYLRSILEHKRLCLFCHYAWILPLSHSLLFPPPIGCLLDFVTLWFLTFALSYFLTLDPSVLLSGSFFKSLILISPVSSLLFKLLNFVISMTIFSYC